MTPPYKFRENFFPDKFLFHQERQKFVKNLRSRISLRFSKHGRRPKLFFSARKRFFRKTIFHPKKKQKSFRMVFDSPPHFRLTRVTVVVVVSVGVGIYQFRLLSVALRRTNSFSARFSSFFLNRWGMERGGWDRVRGGRAVAGVY